MEITGVVGKAFGRSASGALVKFDQADSRQLVNATSGLVKTLAVAGAIGLGAYLISTAFSRETFGYNSVSSRIMLQELGDFNCSPLEYPSNICIPITCVHTPNRNFIGVVHEEEKGLEVICEDDELLIPLERICWLAYSGYESNGSFLGKNIGLGSNGYNLGLIDGSVYRNVDIKSSLKFISVAGLQTIQFPKIKEGERMRGISRLLYGAQIKNIELLKRNLKTAMKNVAKPAIEIIGEEIFTKYFQIKRP